MTPTLIIGLGGTGIRVVTRIYKKFLERNLSLEEKQRFICLCFDTDERDIYMAKETLPFNRAVNISSGQSIQAMYNQLKGVSSVQDWFDEGIAPLYGTRLTEGSAMCRQAARLALLEAELSEKLSAIDNSIAQLIELTQFGFINVKIVCSLAGGTGAGTFLQIAYYVKEVLMEHGVHSPDVTGYFLLADAFREVCHDVTQIDAMRANTYASLKELNTFISRDFLSSSPVEFEYRYGQDNKSLPPYPPYDLCYVMGYDTTQNSFNKLSDFMFYTAADRLVGQNDISMMINNTRQIIQSNGKRYASFGLSKMVYPVDDLFEYFSLRRLSEMLTIWQLIDKNFQHIYEEYKDKKQGGLPAQKPDKGMHYRMTVEDLAHRSDRTGAEFREIWRSTQILDKENRPSKSKAQEYFEQIKAFVWEQVESIPALKKSYESCTSSDESLFLNSDNAERDFQFVTKRERGLDNYKQEVVMYINELKHLFPKQCFFDDLEYENYVFITPDQGQHHLNTFILPKDEELHPIAVRYFLYELQDLIKPSLAKLKEENKRLWDAIEEYVEYFDDPDTKYEIESALDSVKIAQQRSSGLRNKVGNLLSGQNPYKQAKEKYEATSRQQAANLRKYTSGKLLEETFSSMLDNINRLLEESENFFDWLPDALREIENECDSLLRKHDGAPDTNTTYVLASEQIKKDLYDFVISRADAYLFPSVTSAELYHIMYYNVCKDLRNALHSIPKPIDKEARERDFFEFYRKIIAKCVGFMDKRIRESNNDYATKNVIEALKEEAMRACANDLGQATMYMARKILMLKNKAQICGLDNYEPSYPCINVWGMHPSCVEDRVLTESAVEELFGSQNIYVNPQTAAERLISEFFSPFEIVRINTVHLLPVSQFDVNRSAYDSFVNRSHFTPHLDKRWGETDILDEAFELT